MIELTIIACQKGVVLLSYIHGPWYIFLISHYFFLSADAGVLAPTFLFPLLLKCYFV